MGNPAVHKGVSEEMVAHKTEGTALYQALPKDCQSELVPTEPLIGNSRTLGSIPTFETAEPEKQGGLNFLNDGQVLTSRTNLQPVVVHDDACGMKVGTDALLLVLGQERA